ncbi:response regulator [Chthonobacter rhizosphaerae]|uniref:response regulator n=1 Tax=Chthonobacter rhizosphaerae TaxID=2735553 RepID=UPI0015EE50D7|nr:response regulator transcription factor [Chthonobacter rhizosphaerae]
MKILIVDDHVIVRDGVIRLLSAIDGAVMREAATVPDALALFRSDRPDVVVLDINLKGGSGLELLRRIRAEDPSARVVIFSMYSDVVYATSARRAGALGYVSKSATSDQLLVAVLRASRGEAYVDTAIAGEIAETAFSPAEHVTQLSNRELEILSMLADGKSLSDIADTLGVAYKTVANTCTRIKEKLGVERTADLIRFAVENRHIRVVGTGREAGPA